jgi:hypothetical protein
VFENYIKGDFLIGKPICDTGTSLEVLNKISRFEDKNEIS